MKFNKVLVTDNRTQVSKRSEKIKKNKTTSCLMLRQLFYILLYTEHRKEVN